MTETKRLYWHKKGFKSINYSVLKLLNDTLILLEIQATANNLIYVSILGKVYFVNPSTEC